MARAVNTTASSKLITASARNLHLSPRKIRLVTNLVKGMNVNDAQVLLMHLNKKGAPMVANALRSAVANAKNNFSLSPDHLFIKFITADMGQVMKRYFPRARGSAFVIRRKLSHVNVVLEERKAGGGKRKFNLFKKEEKPETQSIDQKEATNIKPAADTSKKSQLFRSDEQKKMSKVANRRRLFNRKAGE